MQCRTAPPAVTVKPGTLYSIDRSSEIANPNMPRCDLFVIFWTELAGQAGRTEGNISRRSVAPQALQFSALLPAV